MEQKLSISENERGVILACGRLEVFKYLRLLNNFNYMDKLPYTCEGKLSCLQKKTFLCCNSFVVYLLSFISYKSIISWKTFTTKQKSAKTTQVFPLKVLPYTVCMFIICVFIATSKQRTSLHRAVASDKKIIECIAKYNDILAELQPTRDNQSIEEILDRSFHGLQLQVGNMQNYNSTSWSYHV